MPIFDVDELAQLQDELAEVWEDIFPDAGELLRGETRVRNDDAPDEFVTVPTVLISGVPCKYRTSNGRETIMADQPQGSELVTITIPSTVKPMRGDRFRVLPKGDEAGFTASVVAVLTKSNAFKLNVICSK